MQNLDSGSQRSDSEGSNLNSEEDQNLLMEDMAKQEETLRLKQQEKMSQSLQELVQMVHKDYQLIYIAAYTQAYRQLLEKIAYQYGCDLHFIKKTYIVSCKDRSKQQAWSICKEKISQQIQKIIHIKAQDTEKRLKMYNSPQVNRYAQQKNVYFCQFNSEIYFHSNCYQKKQLQEKIKQIYKYTNIFTVCFLRKKIPQAIDLLIAIFYKTVLNQYYKERFEKNNLVVELNRVQKSFYILGKPGSPQYMMMQAKKTIKSLIEGITVVVFKKNNLDLKEQTKLKEYLKRISKFPITYGKLSQNVICIISKDNVLRQLLKKTDKIISKVGINSDTSMGIFIPFCYSIDEKKEQVNKICKQMGYDYWGSWGIRYFRPMISSDDEPKDPKQCLQLIIQIIGGFMDVKDNYQVMKQKNQPQNKIDALKKKQMEEQNKYAYILNNSQKDSKELKKLLRRDVTEDNVMMKKRYNAIYSILEGTQIGPFYIEKSQYDKGVTRGQIKLIKQQNLKKGQYFETFLKINDPSINMKNIEQVEALLVEELKKLNQAAKQDKPQGKSFDKERKLAHMIKKLIVVY